MKFKVGDRVKCVKCHDGNIKAVGKVGTVIKFSDTCSDYLIEFDVNVDGHDGCGAGKKGHCWWLFDRHLELARDKNECIVIYRKDNTVTALNKATGDKAVAKCNPADKFDFMTGAKLAFERLTEIPPVSHKKPLYNGKVVCVRERYGELFTVGKIYEFKDGVVIMNNGRESNKYESLDQFHDRNNSIEFLEVVE